jgi:hypothetical protein
VGEACAHRLVLCFVAAFSRYPAALAWAKERLESQWGPVALESDSFQFRETAFYEATMGPDLLKVLWAFEQLIDPASLAARKLLTNQWEHEYAQLRTGNEPRPLNLDPGYLTEAKLILASTKDRDHRIYLERGVFAENTLYFHAGSWQKRPWTYPDYQRADYHQFLVRCREYYRSRKHENT